MESAPDKIKLYGSVTGPGTFPIVLERHSAYRLCALLDAELPITESIVRKDFDKIIEQLSEWAGYEREL